MAERNPFIPSERRQEMEGRTEINEEEANRRFAEKQAKLQEQAGAPRQEQGRTAVQEPDTDEERQPS